MHSIFIFIKAKVSCFNNLRRSPPKKKKEKDSVEGGGGGGGSEERTPHPTTHPGFDGQL